MMNRLELYAELEEVNGQNARLESKVRKLEETVTGLDEENARLEDLVPPQRSILSHIVIKGFLLLWLLGLIFTIYILARL